MLRIFFVGNRLVLLSAWSSGELFEQRHLHMGGMGSVMHGLASAEHEGGTVTKTGEIKTCLV